MVQRKRKTTVPRQRTTSTIKKAKTTTKRPPLQKSQCQIPYKTPPDFLLAQLNLNHPEQPRVWLAMPREGRPTKFQSPEHLLGCCLEYFEWIHNNPFQEAKIVSDKGTPCIQYAPKMRVMTIIGLCNFLGIQQEVWAYWGKSGHEFLRVQQYVNGEIYNQKFAGASSGFFNASIIARDLGLVDKKDLTSSDRSMSPRIESGMSAKEAALLYKQMVKGDKV